MSFIEDYMITVQDSEPPMEYHAWCMLSTLSAFAGRRFWFPFGPMNFYCNLMVMLVGEPGMRKSTAMNRSKNIVRFSDICPIAATQITKQALTLKMSSTVDGQPKKNPFIGQRFYEYNNIRHEYNQYAIFATEFVDFIAVDPQGFLDFLTAVWDEPTIEVETKNKGQDYVNGPYITLLGCLTPEKLKGYLKLSVLTGGFARRTAFIFSANKKTVNWPSYTDEQKAAELRCMEFGRQLQKRSGPFIASEETKRYYEEWNPANAQTIRDRHPHTRGWYESKGEMLWKISMLVALAESEELIIELPHYKSAMRFCGMVEKNLERVFEGTGINPNAAAISQVIHMLEEIGIPMNRKHIEVMFMDSSTSLSELRDTITQLVQVGRLAERTLYDQTRQQLLGSVLATPTTMARYTDLELVTFLARREVPSRDSDSLPDPNVPDEQDSL